MQDAAPDRAVNAVGGFTDGFHCHRVATFQSCHLRDRAHDADVFNRLMRHAARGCNAWKRADEPDLASGMGDRRYQLVIGVTVHADAYAVWTKGRHPARPMPTAKRIMFCSATPSERNCTGTRTRNPSTSQYGVRMTKACALERSPLVSKPTPSFVRRRPASTICALIGSS